ncbi:hypothetical protein [Methanolobus psychrotolerans]|uniref:hypothetical protein n=1 Tax=Methanolobus psychrotolerans TaxID=1874706 RepID=UPI0013EB1589|nr:hypothetical protein [Methanolobus psychrotolerans]
MTVQSDKLRYVGFYAPREMVDRVETLSKNGRFVKKSEVLRAAIVAGLDVIERN